MCSAGACNGHASSHTHKSEELDVEKEPFAQGSYKTIFRGKWRQKEKDVVVLVLRSVFSSSVCVCVCVCVYVYWCACMLVCVRVCVC